MAANLFLRRWRKLFWHLHRRAGITSLLFLAIMAITGIALNHGDGWKLFDRPLPYRLSTWIYGDLQVKEVYRFNSDSLDLYQRGDTFYLGDKRLEFDCPSNAAKIPWSTSPGVALQLKPSGRPDVFWLGCQSSVYGFQPDGVFIEKIPLQVEKFSRLGSCGQNLCIKQFDHWYALDDHSLKLSRLDESQSVHVLEKTRVSGVPEALKTTPPELDIGRLIADIHSGVIFGRPGRLFVDLLGVVVLFLCATGCYLWLGNKRP